MTAYYNEIDPQAAAWLRELVRRGLIAPGEVDERGICDISPDDIHHFTQCHFFAGIGVWSYALRRAGWSDDRPVWTGSCPCQPFSSAGKGGGFDDERHLWPSWYWLIDQCRPPVVFGEQVASKDAEPWLDLVQADLEALAYAVGAVPFPSAGIGAPHIRDRLYWVADAMPTGRTERLAITGYRSLAGSSSAGGVDLAGSTRLERQRSGHQAAVGQRQGSVRSIAEAGELSGMAEPDSGQFEGVTEFRGPERNGHDAGRAQGSRGAASCGDDGGVANTDFNRQPSRRLPIRSGRQDQTQTEQPRVGSDDGIREPQWHLAHGPGAGVDDRLRDVALWPGPVNGLWRDADWLFCRDGKWRPVEPGTFPLAHGAPARVGRLRGYGNAINAEAAKAFVEAYLEAAA